MVQSAVPVGIIDAIERLFPETQDRERARVLGVSSSYYSLLKRRKRPFAARLLRRLRHQHPELRPWCDAALLSDDGRSGFQNEQGTQKAVG